MGAGGGGGGGAGMLWVRFDDFGGLSSSALSSDDDVDGSEDLKKVVDL